MNSYPWFALHVRPRSERSVASLLRYKGFTEFLPLYRTRRRWSDRFKEVEMPLFPGYLFCRFDPEHRLPVLLTPGVDFIVGLGKVPVPVEETEIEAIQAVLNSGLGLEPCAYLQEGEWVRIMNGPLCGVEGIFLEVKNQHRLLVSVTMLHRSVAVEIDRSWLLPLTGRRHPMAMMGSFPASSVA